MAVQTPPTTGTAGDATADAAPGPRWEPLALGALGLACGLSPFVDFALQAQQSWGLVGFGVAVLAAALGLRRLPGPAVAALAGLVALAVLAVVSGAWADRPDRAMAAGGRWALYAVWVALLLALLRRQADARWLLGGVGAGVLAVASVVLLRMLDGHGAGLFLERRLNDPVGYVNAEAVMWLAAFWPLVAIAERGRRRVAPAAAGTATLLACLLLCGQSRGALLGLLAAAALLLAAVPGRRARTWVLLAVAAGTAVAAPALLALDDGNAVAPSPGAQRTAALAAIAAALGVAAVCAAALWARGDARWREQLTDVARRGPSVIGIAAAVLVLLTSPVWIPKAHHAARDFTRLSSTTGVDDRLLSTGGHRYDYWRIAAHELRDHPIGGVGAGNFTRDYFRERRTPEDITQPHSVELQTLAELGLLGGAALLLFLVGVGAGFDRVRRAARGDAAARALAVAAGGAFASWLVETSADWTHLIAGVTGMALAAGAVLLAPWERPGAAMALPWLRGRVPGRAAPVAVRAGLAVVAVAAAVLCGRLALADHAVRAARSEVAGDPAAAVRDARRALRLQPQQRDARVVLAAAHARAGDAAGARAVLERMAADAPRDPVPPALLGDLAAREGDLPAAQAAYRRALALDPLDPQLRQLAADPSQATRAP